jgi:hypothetical protein
VTGALERSPAPAEQQVKRLAERLQAVDVGERAVVDAGVLVEHRFAAKLQAAHRGQHFPAFRRGKGGADRIVQPAQAADAGQILRRDFSGGQRRERGIAQRRVGIMRQVHVAHAADGLRPSLPATELGGVTGIAGNGYKVLQSIGGMGNGQSRAIHGGRRV